VIQKILDEVAMQEKGSAGGDQIFEIYVA